MPSYDAPSVSVSRRGHGRLGSELLRTVIWVRGEHDIATRAHLSLIIDQVTRLDDADIVVDLSDVTFMDASTIGALVDAHNRLRALSCSLSVRAPSPPARRLLDLCGLAQLVEEHPAPTRWTVAPALGSWVDVPAWDRAPDVAPAPVAHEAPSQEPARLTARPRDAPAESSHQGRAPS